MPRQPRRSPGTGIPEPAGRRALPRRRDGPGRPRRRGRLQPGSTAPQSTSPARPCQLTAPPAATPPATPRHSSSAAPTAAPAGTRHGHLRATAAPATSAPASAHRGRGPEVFPDRSREPVGGGEQAPAALPRDLRAGRPGPARRPAGRLRRGGAAEQHDGGGGRADVRGRGGGRRRPDPGERLPLLRHPDGHLQRLRGRRGGAPRRIPRPPARATRSTRPAGRSTSATAAGPAASSPASPSSRPQCGPRPMPTASVSWSATPGWSTTVTGYFYESWHLRYVGVEAATDMRNAGHRDPRRVLRARSRAGLPLDP